MGKRIRKHKKKSQPVIQEVVEIKPPPSQGKMLDAFSGDRGRLLWWMKSLKPGEILAISNVGKPVIRNEIIYLRNVQ